MEGVIPMLGLLIISIVLATQSLPIAAALASVLEESAMDLSDSAETKSTGEHITRHYIPDSAKHSVDNAAYDLGPENAGVSWNSPLDDASVIYRNIEQAWEAKANENLENRLSETNCQVLNDIDLEIYSNEDQENLFNSRIKQTNLSLSPENHEDRISIECQKNSRSITYKEADYIQELSTPSRYAALGNFTAEFYTEAERQYENLNLDSEYTGSHSSCPGSGSNSIAESRAESSLRSDTPDFSDVDSVVSNPPNTSTSGSTIENYITSYESTPTSCTVSCGPNCTEPASGTEVTATVTPTSSEMIMEIETDESIPIFGVYETLKIKVEEYVYSH